MTKVRTNRKIAMTVMSPFRFSQMTCLGVGGAPTCDVPSCCGEEESPKERAAGARSFRGFSPVVDSLCLRQVLVDQLGHIKHRHLLLSTEHSLEVVIGVDHTTFFGILQIMLLDIRPQLFRNFCAWGWLVTNNSGKHFTWLHWLHKSRVRSAGRGFLRGRFLSDGCGLLWGGLLGSSFLRRCLLCGH